MSKNKLILFIIVVLASVIFYSQFHQRLTKIPFVKENETQIVPVITSSKAPRFSTVAANLEVPWALVFLPDASILFTERVGRVRFIDKKGELLPTPIAIIDDVLQQGEGGLLGITIHPDFSKNHFVYLYYTYANNNGQTLNRVVRLKFENNTLSDKTTIVDAIPGAFFHNGGRIKFGPDGFLYITTGDSQNPSLAQNTKSLAGKILRVDPEGKPAPNSPFKNEVFSFGHRNPQGLAWDKDNRLWATEHGQIATDELNLIEIGENYGWPTIRGEQTQDRMVSPKLQSAEATWAPAGMAYVEELNSLFFAGLKGQALFQVNVDQLTLKGHFKAEFGRIRDVILGPDNLLYITTSNRDGRGIPDNSDDKIIRVNPNKL